ncbi:MAG: DUF7693 family protein [Pseudomonas sp.]
MPNTATPLTGREVYQVLKDVALEIRTLRLACGSNSAGLGVIDNEGWTLTLVIQGDTLVHCEACTSADGRTATSETWQRYGTDPVELLSKWERAQVERLLKAL